MIPAIHMSQRFQRAYGKASYELKKQAEGTVHDLVRAYRSDPETLLHRYDTVVGLQERVMEIDIGGGERLLAHYNDDGLFLIDMGGHETPGRYDDQKARHDLRNNVEAYPFFWPERGGFFRRNPDRRIELLTGDEVTSDWIYYLGDDQARVDRKIRNRVFKFLDYGKEVPPYFIVGGPGTGKTCILLNLLRFFCDIDPDFTTRIAISKAHIDYVERSTNANISQYRTYMRGGKFKGSDLLLFDDPKKKWHIERILKWHKAGDIGAAVIAFDPLQLEDALADAEFSRLVQEYGVHVYELKTCYRQKENVGAVTKHVIDMIADSSPFDHPPKVKRHKEEHGELTTLANAIEFINPAGYVEYYPDASVSEIQQEVKRILQYEWMMWEHHPGLLVVEELRKGYELSEAANEVLWPLEERGYIQRVSLKSVEEVKGLEFQHVFIFIDQELYKEIQHGFSGTGRKVYNERRLFRIPFSRAKDRGVTFAL
jgi:hypothetical protein